MPNSRLHLEIQFPSDAQATRAAEQLPDLLYNTPHFIGATLGSSKLDLQEQPQAPTEFEKSLEYGVDLFEPEIQKRLDTTLTSLIRSSDELSDKRAARLIKKLAGYDIGTVRDLLAAGMHSITVMDISPNLRKFVKEAIHNEVPEIPLVEYAEPSDAALFCESIDQLSYVASLDPARLRLVERNMGNRVTVGDVVRRAKGEDVLTDAQWYRLGGLGSRAIQYATAFEEAKNRPLRLF